MTEISNSGWDLPSEPFLVGDFTVDPATNSIGKDGMSVKLEPRAMDLLLYLVYRPGTVVSREELEDEVWKDTVVGYEGRVEGNAYQPCFTGKGYFCNGVEQYM